METEIMRTVTVDLTVTSLSGGSQFSGSGLQVVGNTIINSTEFDLGEWSINLPDVCKPNISIGDVIQLVVTLAR
jgi:hypothetical protein